MPSGRLSVSRLRSDRRMADGASATTVGSARGEVSAVPGENAVERHAGHHCRASRAAGGHDASPRAGWCGAGSGKQVDWPSSCRSCSIRERRREARSRLRIRSIRSVARWARVGYGSDLRQCRCDEGLLRAGDGPRSRRRSSPGVFSGRDRAPARAGAVLTARERRGSVVCGVDALRSPDLRVPSVREAGQRYVRRRWRASRRTICERSTASTSCRTT